MNTKEYANLHINQEKCSYISLKMKNNLFLKTKNFKLKNKNLAVYNLIRVTLSKVPKNKK